MGYGDRLSYLEEQDAQLHGEQVRQIEEQQNRSNTEALMIQQQVQLEQMRQEQQLHQDMGLNNGLL